jgi:hypothetical protein
MGEWVMPSEAGKGYEELKKNTDRKYYYLIHGGYFKNFLRRYPEANLMHKRMVYVSQNISDKLEEKLALWRGQCSCAYWHGIFGGLYLPHLREAIYKNLIQAENFNIRKELKSDDFDADGEEEIIYSDENFFSVLRPKWASFIEFDDRKRECNLLNYLGRREEKYHHKLLISSSGDGVKSIHEISRSKVRNLHDYLLYDQYERGFGLDRKLDKLPTAKDFCHQENIGRILEYTKYEILNKERFCIKFSGELEKIVEISDENNRILQFGYKGDVDLLGVEFSLGIFHHTILLNGKKSLFEMQEMEKIENFTIDAGFKIKFCANEKFSLRTYPIKTVSSSESGFELNFQGVALLLIFKNLPVIRIEI